MSNLQQLDTVIMFRGTIYEGGYGLIARKVMRDRNISAKAKAIYAYLCSFATADVSGDRTAFPGVSLMKQDLGIRSDDTFYKCRNELVNAGYISVEQREGPGGRFSSNMYFIEAVPEAKTDASPYPNFSSTENPSTDNSSTIINKSFISNRFEHEEDNTTTGDVVPNDWDKQYAKNLKTLFKGKTEQELTETEQWFLLYVTDGKLNLELAKRLVKKVNLSKIHKKVLFAVIDSALAKIKTGEVKHPVNWIVALFENEQLKT